MDGSIQMLMKAMPSWSIRDELYLTRTLKAGHVRAGGIGLYHSELPVASYTMLNRLDHHNTTVSKSASQQTIHTLQSETGVQDHKEDV